MKTTITFKGSSKLEVNDSAPSVDMDDKTVYLTDADGNTLGHGPFPFADVASVTFEPESEYDEYANGKRPDPRD